MSDDFSIPHKPERLPVHKDIGEILIPNDGESFPAKVSMGGAMVFQIGGYLMRLSIEEYQPDHDATELDNQRLKKFISSVRGLIEKQE